MGKVASGETATLMVAAVLNEAGLAVLRPVREDLPFDLAVWFKERFYRIQVKRAQRKSTGAFEIPFRKTTVNSKGPKVYKYTAAHTDYIIGVIVDLNDFYCFPMSVVDQFTTGAWVHPAGRSKFSRRPRVDFYQFRNKIEIGGQVFTFGRGPGIDEGPGSNPGAGKTVAGAIPVSSAI